MPCMTKNVQFAEANSIDSKGHASSAIFMEYENLKLYQFCRVIPHQQLLKCLPNTCNLVIHTHMLTQILNKEEQASNNSIEIDSCVVTMSLDNRFFFYINFPVI